MAGKSMTEINENNSITASIILPTFNRANLLDQCVSSVLSQSFQSWELIVSDDESTDNTSIVMEQITKKDPRIRYLRNQTRLGLPKNRNRAIQASKGHFVFFIEDDIILEKDCLLNLISTFQQLADKGEPAGAIAPALITVTSEKNVRRDLLDFGREKMVPKLKANPCVVDQYTGLIYRNYSDEFTKVYEVEDIHACSLYLKELFDKGFKYGEVYTGNYIGEETEFHYRLRKMGYKLYFQPEAVLYHKTVSAGGCRIPLYKWSYYFVRNHIYFLLRNQGIRSAYMVPCFLAYLLYMLLKYAEDRLVIFLRHAVKR